MEAILQALLDATAAGTAKVSRSPWSYWVTTILGVKCNNGTATVDTHYILLAKILPQY